MLIGLEYAHRINIYKCKQLQALPHSPACSMGPLIVGQTNKVFPLFFLLPPSAYINLFATAVATSTLPMLCAPLLCGVHALLLSPSLAPPGICHLSVLRAWFGSVRLPALAHVLRAVSCCMALAGAFGLLCPSGFWGYCVNNYTLFIPCKKVGRAGCIEIAKYCF